MKKTALLFLTPLLALCPAFAEETVHPTGYTDTPLIPGSKWKVHDDARPRPVVVTPGKEAGAPPSDAIILFDGKDLTRFRKEKGEPVVKPIKDGAFEVTAPKPADGDLYTKEEFGDIQLHVEWQSPNPPASNSQHRGNSGLFIMNQYELQVLDCHENKTYADGQAGGIYGQTPPMVNASRKPGEWQVYDITFEAPVFKDGKVVKPAYVTIFHNGVCVQNHTEILGGTKHKAAAAYTPHAEKAPIRIQDHKDMPSVKYRNIWVRPLKKAE